MRLSLAALALAVIGSAAATAPATSAGEAGAALPLRARVQRLEAEVAAAEDISALKRLQRAYGYFVDKGLWEDLAVLFTDDAVANYPAGTFIGRTSIREHLYVNVGGGKVGDLGLGDGRLYDHMNIQPVVQLDPGGRTAKGRWRALAMFGSYGGGAVWAEGIYEMTYRKDHGVWKIQQLDYYSGFGAPYQVGWGAAPPASASAGDAPRVPVARRTLAHPADRERNLECDGFPKACIAPFHYPNPGRSAAAAVWRLPEGGAELPQAHASSTPDLELRIADLAHRVELLNDGQQLENLQRIYGYYLDRAMWDQVSDLFADDGTIELAQQGVYAGKRRVREFLGTLGHDGLMQGWLNDHIQLQIIADVAADGASARVRSRELAMTGTYGGHGTWSGGVYENAFVKDHGVWKFKSLHFYPTFISDYDQGWSKDAQPAPAASLALPPDRPPSEVYEIYPKAHVPPFHYRNPVTGEIVHYPRVGGPSAALAAAALQPAGHWRAARPRDAAATLAAAERGIERIKDYDELENLESAYGYYLDKNLWNDLADLFARDSSIELAQRGLYKGQDHVRAFLLKVFGRGQEGPVAGRLGNHLQLQPVIDVAEDGRHAHIRSRVLQQMNFGGRASTAGGIYENEAVKEDGIWRLSVDHAYNTFAAAYEGGWARSAGRGTPGPSAEDPPDTPPTHQFEMFPSVYDIPFHYANPVTGRTAVPPIATNTPGMPAEVAAALREIGAKVEGPRTSALYAPLQPHEPYANVLLARDLAYGTHERNVLDVFSAADRGHDRPVIVFVHGGGFSRGAKHSPDSPFYDNVGVWAAAHGLIGVTINYRLAPQFQWPSGIEDLTAVVAWLKAHAAEYGGDPNGIFLWGHSAGAAHVADYVAHVALTGAKSEIRGAILTSGFYDLGREVSIWKAYYGDDVAKYAERSSLPGLLKSATPLLVTNAELDPETFKPQTEQLVSARAAAGRPVGYLSLPNHSHLSELYAVGTADDSLSAPVLAFVRTNSAQRR